MRVLLVRPVCTNERFGLGPFFRVEPLGLEYVAAALLARGHEVKIADLRFGPSLGQLLDRFRPRVVGVACAHTVDVPAALAAARAVKQRDAAIVTLLGGHAAASYPQGLFDGAVDAIAVEDGEVTVPAFVEAVAARRSLRGVAGLWVRESPPAAAPNFARTAPGGATFELDACPAPARHLVEPFQDQYFVVHKRPLYAVETMRGCPYRCRFCSIWPLHDRRARLRGVEATVRDLARVGENVFVVDDLFWYPRERSLELSAELDRRRVRKDFVLVQARLDTVARSPELLRAWRPFARLFDVFFGFEAPTDRHLARLDKDSSASALEEGVRAARDHGYGVSGNFVVDPDWEEEDFRAMWDVVDRLGLDRAGYTILTPLPGTPLFDEMAARIREEDLSRYDMHHLLFEPRLGRRRFFELFTESWRRNVLGRGQATGKWIRWLREVRPMQALSLARTLLHAQRNLSVEAHLAEAFPLQIPSIPEGATAASARAP